MTKKNAHIRGTYIQICRRRRRRHHRRHMNSVPGRLVQNIYNSCRFHFDSLSACMHLKNCVLNVECVWISLLKGKFIFGHRITTITNDKKLWQRHVFVSITFIRIFHAIWDKLWVCYSDIFSRSRLPSSDTNLVRIQALYFGFTWQESTEYCRHHSRSPKFGEIWKRLVQPKTQTYIATQHKQNINIRTEQSCFKSIFQWLEQSICQPELHEQLSSLFLCTSIPQRIFLSLDLNP